MRTARCPRNVGVPAVAVLKVRAAGLNDLAVKNTRTESGKIEQVWPGRRLCGGLRPLHLHERVRLDLPDRRTEIREGSGISLECASVRFVGQQQPLELLPPPSGQADPGPVLEDHGAVAVGKGPDLPDGPEVHHGGPVDPEEARLAQ